MAVAMEELVAQTILQGADAMYGRFLDVTAGRKNVLSNATGKAYKKH